MQRTAGRITAALLAALLLAGCAAPAAPTAGNAVPAATAAVGEAPAALPTPIPTEPPRAASPGAYTPEPTLGISAAERLSGMEDNYGIAAYEKGDAAEQAAYEAMLFERNLRTGKSERRLGADEHARMALEAAYKARPEDVEAMTELCLLHIEMGRRSEARSIAQAAWRDGEGSAEAGMLLATIALLERDYGAAESYKAHKKVQTLLRRNAGRGRILYAGDFGANDLPQGQGVGVYSYVDEEGTVQMPVYIGEYSGGSREGLGHWVHTEGTEDGGYTYDIYAGVWAGDAPNGAGTLTSYNYRTDAAEKAFMGTVKRSGSYVNGLEDGDMAVESTVGGASGSLHTCTYKSSMGLRQTTGATYAHSDGSIGHWYAKCENCAGWTISQTDLQNAWGVAPWGAD